MCLKWILRLIFSSLTVHAFSHEADRGGNTKEALRRSWIEDQWRQAGKKPTNSFLFFYFFFPPAVYLRMF